MVIDRLLREYVLSFQAGYGPVSDGVPEPIGRGGDSEKPTFEEVTKRYRKART